jgi:hypothetical protein
VHAAGSAAAFTEHMNLQSLALDEMGYAKIEGRNYRVSEFEADLKKKFVGSRAAGSFITHLTALRLVDARSFAASLLRIVARATDDPPKTESVACL